MCHRRSNESGPHFEVTEWMKLIQVHIQTHGAKSYLTICSGHMCMEDFSVIRFNNIIDLGFKMFTWIKCDSVVSSCGLNLVCLWTNKVNEEVTVRHVSESLSYMITSLTSLCLKRYQHIIQCDEHHGFFSRNQKLPPTSYSSTEKEMKKEMSPVFIMKSVVNTQTKTQQNQH